MSPLPEREDPDSGAPADRPTVAAHPTRVLVLLATAALLVNFVETMLVPALPRLSTFFDGSPYTTVAWVLSAYLVVGVCTIPVFGKLGDLYGKRRVLSLVLSIYAVAVTLAPFTPQLGAFLGMTRADSIFLLIGVRGVQGIGLAMFPLALAMVAESLPKERVAPAQGLVASMFAVGAAAGLVGGSWLIQNSGWQFAYESIIPFAFLLPALATAWLPGYRRGTGGALDVPGATLLGGALATFLLALTLGPTWGWTSLQGGSAIGVPLGVPELLAVTLALTGLFVWRELVAEQPVINLGRLRERNIALSYLGALLVGVGLFTAFVTLTVLVEFPVVGLGRSIVDFGIASIPTTLGMFIAAPLVGRGVARYGPRPMILFGALTAFSGFALLALFHSSYDAIVLEAIPTFVGLVSVLVSVTNVIALSSDHTENGIQMGLTETLQDLGASVGPVLVSTFLATFTRVIPVPSAVSVTGTVMETVPSQTAFTLLFVVGAALAAVLGLVGLLLRNYRAAPAVGSAESTSGSEFGLPSEV